MMDGTYFVGRNELLQWINSTLDLQLSKIEQTASGAVACQLLDALHPGSVQLSRVDFNAKSEYEMINNYKVLQAAFTKLGIERMIEVSKLVKGRALDNIEFMQWMKSYFDSHAGQGLEYDAEGRRALSKTGSVKTALGGASMARSREGGVTKRAPLATASASINTAPAAPKAAVLRKTTSASSKLAGGSQEVAQLQGQLREANEQVAGLKLKVDNVERERDFYFSKLRDIEILCQRPELQAIPIVKVFEQILYAADEREAKEVMSQAMMQHVQQPAQET